MEKLRQVEKVLRSEPTVEGAGVNLVRAFGFDEAQRLDPFLMLDDFHSDNPLDYMAGFPFHPHRGMETITYMISGSMEHADNLGNRGLITSGDLQWMTAGSGIIHQEMPRRFEGRLQGFQLWVNLPRESKMMAPRYRDIRKEMIPTAKPSEGVEVKIVAGEVRGIKGPVRDLVVEVEYLDVAMESNKEFYHKIRRGQTAFAYIFEGSGFFGHEDQGPIGLEHTVIFSDGDEVHIRSGKDKLRFLLVSGVPLHEPIAWRGPVVMNSERELETAFHEIREGNFVKHKTS